jgi:hypothetical protein
MFNRKLKKRVEALEKKISIQLEGKKLDGYSSIPMFHHFYYKRLTIYEAVSLILEYLQVQYGEGKTATKPKLVKVKKP